MTTTSTVARPRKLKDGTWGAVADTPVKIGDRITIRTSQGKTWDVTVQAVVWTDPKGATTIFRTASVDRPNQHPRRVRALPGGGWICRACEEENPASARTCWECGGGRG